MKKENAQEQAHTTIYNHIQQLETGIRAMSACRKFYADCTTNLNQLQSISLTMEMRDMIENFHREATKHLYLMRFMRIFAIWNGPNSRYVRSMNAIFDSYERKINLFPTTREDALESVDVIMTTARAVKAALMRLDHDITEKKSRV